MSPQDKKGYGKEHSSYVSSIIGRSYGLRSTRRSMFQKCASRMVSSNEGAKLRRCPNKGMEGALTARGVLLVSIPTLCYPVILCFTFLFTSSLSTLHCLGQVLFFLKITHFAKHVTGMKQPFCSKDVAFVNFLCIASQGITPQCERN